MSFPSDPHSYPSPYPTAPIPSRNRRHLTLILGAIVAVLALVISTIVVLSMNSRDGNPFTPALRLFGVGETPDDPFTPSVALTNRALPDQIRLASTRGASDRGVRVVNGGQSGLYGGGSTASCDVAALGNSLMGDPSAARAWASVFGISTNDIPYYLNSLTPVVLTADTWITNHTYRGGTANAFQSILQAGTPVLIDGSGVPRAVCSCGNPLAPPAATPVGGYRVVGTTWRGYQTRDVVRVAYNTENVTVVNNTTVVTPAADPTAALATAVLSLINVDNAQLFTRPVGNVLNLAGLPPQSGPLPTPAALNVPFTASTDEQAAENGLAAAGSTQAAGDVEARAAANGNAPEQAGSTGSSAAAESGTSEAAGAGAGATSAAASSAAPERRSPTTFTGQGDQIDTFTFDDGGTSVTCTVPTGVTPSPVTVTCSDTVAREVSSADLERVRVQSATDVDGVWSVGLTRVTPAGSPSVTTSISRATWRAVPVISTPTTAETTTETTTEAPTTETTAPETTETTPEPTTEAPTTTETTTEVPTTTTTTTEEEATPTE